VREGQVYGNDDRPIALRGVNWYGFELESYAVHGLDKRNWKDLIHQVHALGFNAVRLPFCPGTLHRAQPTGIDYRLNPDLAGLDSLALLDRIVEGLNAEGLYVLLDHHSPDCQSLTPLWYTDAYSEDAWIADLRLVARRYRHVPRVIGIDLKNEIHDPATWGSGDPRTDWKLASERAAREVLEIAPRWLIFLSGIQGGQPPCSEPADYAWGGNFQPLGCQPPDIPATQLVLAPHAYGPDPFMHSYFKDEAFPGNLPAIWQRDFGQFSDKGYTVVIGEFGGKLGRGEVRDVAWQNAFVDWLIAKHLDNTFYWCLNPESADTGGILEDDWMTVREDKMDLLRRLWRGTPAPAAP